MRLTVGVVAQDGLPHLRKCLDSLPALADCADIVEFILVDAASSDGTLAAMCAFSEGRTDTRVFAISGRTNRSATRNVILRNASPGAVFLVDGDVAVNRAFLVAALEELECGSADILFGRLPEILHDAEYRPTGERDDRYGVRTRGYVRRLYGIALLGPKAYAAGVLYDEDLRLAEDMDLGQILADRFRILALPIDMGTHYTIRYYAPARIEDFYRMSYMRPHGQMMRKHLLRPWRIWRAREASIGAGVGIFLQLVLLGSLLAGSVPALLVTGGIVALDVTRFWRQRRLSEYVPIRLVSGWQILHGFLIPEKSRLCYTVKQVVPED